MSIFSSTAMPLFFYPKSCPIGERIMPRIIKSINRRAWTIFPFMHDQFLQKIKNQNISILPKN
ncbi:unnamed protein product, partial [Nesidiocoris tenuis]